MRNASGRAGLGLVALGLFASAALAQATVPSPAGGTAPSAFLAAAEARTASAPRPPGCAAPAALEGRVISHPMIAAIPGAASGTTGGLGRQLLMVSAGDDDRGAGDRPGTLRWAVESARRAGGGWIAFSPTLRGQTIELATGLRLPGDTTLDGGCGGVTLRAAARETILRVDDVANVIISGLTFAKTPYEEPRDRTGDAIGVSGAYDRVAVLHNAFERCGDGCVDVVRRDAMPQRGRVTIAFNRIARHNKAMLIGALSCTETRRIPECADPLAHLQGAMRPTMRVTLLGNVFLGTSQRHPKVVATAFVHSANNLVVLAPSAYSDGRDSATYGAVAGSGGLIASEGDVFVSTASRPHLALGPVAALGGLAAREANGAVMVDGAVLLGALRVVPYRAELAGAERPEPGSVPVVDAARDPLSLAACLLRMAGPHGAALRWPEACGADQASVDPNLGRTTRTAARAWW